MAFYTGLDFKQKNASTLWSRWWRKKEIADFWNRLLKIGEDRILETNGGYFKIDIPHDFLIEIFNEPIVSIVKITYSDFIYSFHSYDYLKTREILASKIEVVDQINVHVLSLMSDRIIFLLLSCLE